MALDLEALVAEVSPDGPCGVDLEAANELFAFELKLKGTPEDQFANKPAQPPNWREIRDESIALFSRSHDLRIALALLQSLLHTEGLPGLRDGLTLVRGLLEKHWADLYPRLDPEDDNDPTQRVGILSALCNLNSVLNPITYAAIVESPKLGRFSLRDWRVASGKQSAPDTNAELPQLATIQAAFTDAELDSLTRLNDAAVGCLDQVAAIDTFLTSIVGSETAPDLRPLSDLLKEMRAPIAEELARRGAVDASDADAALDGASSVADAQRGTGVPPGGIAGRQDVVRILDLLCEYYARSEPSSPVPLLLKRARTLASKDFMEIIKNLAPDALAQVQAIRGPEESD